MHHGSLCGSDTHAARNYQAPLAHRARECQVGRRKVLRNLHQPLAEHQEILITHWLLIALNNSLQVQKGRLRHALLHVVSCYTWYHVTRGAMLHMSCYKSRHVTGHVILHNTSSNHVTRHDMSC